MKGVVEVEVRFEFGLVFFLELEPGLVLSLFGAKIEPLSLFLVALKVFIDFQILWE